MPYSAEISRTHPTCFLFLIDQSGSMAQPLGGGNKTKAQGVADSVNRLLQSLVFRCTKGNQVLDRYLVGVIGYGSKVGTALGGALAGRDLVPVSQIAQHPLRVEQRTTHAHGEGGGPAKKVRFPIWFEPAASGKTPMCQALGLAAQTMQDFLSRHADCFPPIVINISDGLPTDGDPRPIADRIRNLSSSDGNVLLFNLHLSYRKEQPVEFPDSEESLPNDHARLLFQMSSPLPPPMLKMQVGDFVLPEGSRGFVFNADLVAVIQFLDIGTRVDL
jgi:hypothetical protein